MDLREIAKSEEEVKAIIGELVSGTKILMFENLELAMMILIDLDVTEFRELFAKNPGLIYTNIPDSEIGQFVPGLVMPTPGYITFQKQDVLNPDKTLKIDYVSCVMHYTEESFTFYSQKYLPISFPLLSDINNKIGQLAKELINLEKMAKELMPNQNSVNLDQISVYSDDVKNKLLITFIAKDMLMHKYIHYRDFATKLSFNVLTKNKN